MALFIMMRDAFWNTDPALAGFHTDLTELPNQAIYLLSSLGAKTLMGDDYVNTQDHL